MSLLQISTSSEVAVSNQEWASLYNKPTYLPKSYYVSLLLFNSGSHSRLTKSLYTFPFL